jgi:hypothetical protein
MRRAEQEDLVLAREGPRVRDTRYDPLRFERREQGVEIEPIGGPATVCTVYDSRSSRWPLPRSGEATESESRWSQNGASLDLRPGRRTRDAVCRGSASIRV